MRAFCQLYAALDESTATRDKLTALIRYFSATEIAPLDRAWGLLVLLGGKLKRPVPAGVLRALIAQASGLPPWLVEESYAHVGDLAETATLLVDHTQDDAQLQEQPLSQWLQVLLPALRKLQPAEQQQCIARWWSGLPAGQRFVLNKLLTGSLRVGVSRALVTQALAQMLALDRDLLAHRLSGDWRPSAAAWATLTAPIGSTLDDDRPYPFFLASALETDAAELGEPHHWQAEWKYDGIRAQLIRRGASCKLWSRGEERLDGRFPEIEQAAALLPAGVYDGEILCWRTAEDAPLPFAALQKRIGRLKPGARTLTDYPVVLVIYDVLERDGADWRARPLQQRRSALQQCLVNITPSIRLSPAIAFAQWSELALARAQSRQRGVEGLMLKRLDSSYQVGRKRGDWWKWKVDPLTVDAVLIYAQAGHGRRSNLHTDYTFAVWSGERLVPFAKAYSGLSDAEIARLDRWIRAHTRERFGPVRSVEPLQVFELAFEGINLSSRHKSGVAVRFPRIVRWREDKSAEQADRLEDLRALLQQLASGEN